MTVRRSEWLSVKFNGDLVGRLGQMKGSGDFGLEEFIKKRESVETNRNSFRNVVALHSF